MTISLVRLDPGCSLEFGVADIERVRAAIERHYGKPDTDRSSPILTVYTFANTKLIFQNEWDDPCLLASDAVGTAMLEQLAGELAW
ncbi:hypothetical protein ACIQC9_02930 [Brevundimonas sp. NPDC092305]|uniref:hypothetical protein n=1 Tax=Brevundimonas sp. NPDC092305 TaxID=3363957 RepID=UPI003812872F